MRNRLETFQETKKKKIYNASSSAESSEHGKKSLYFCKMRKQEEQEYVRRWNFHLKPAMQRNSIVFVALVLYHWAGLWTTVTMNSPKFNREKLCYLGKSIIVPKTKVVSCSQIIMTLYQHDYISLVSITLVAFGYKINSLSPSLKTTKKVTKLKC